MRNLFTAFILCFLFSCQNEKILQLPEISLADTNEVLDVSHAYIFYDESKPDSLELNRKNLIGTTNWLINVDKRLTLEQAIPQVKFLQDKKRSAKMHKNEAAKNYFTCSNTSIKNLGFIDFTDVVYHLNSIEPSYLKPKPKESGSIILYYKKDKSILKFDLFNDQIISRGLFNFSNLESEPSNNIILSFDKALSFQDYITYKVEIKKHFPKSITIDKNEFIY